MRFNWLDYTVLAFIGGSVLIGLVRGLVRELCALLNWAFAAWIGFCWHQSISEYLPTAIHSRSIRLLIGFVSVFILTLIFGAILTWILGKLVEKTGFGGTDRTLGFVFGGIRGMLVTTLLLLAARLTPLPEETWWRSAVLISYFRPLESWTYDHLPSAVAEYIQIAEFEQSASPKYSEVPRSEVSIQAEEELDQPRENGPSAESVKTVLSVI